MRNFPPEKVMTAREDRLYQIATNDVDVVLVRRGRNKVVQMQRNDPWKRGRKRRHSREEATRMARADCR